MIFKKLTHYSQSNLNYKMETNAQTHFSTHIPDGTIYFICELNQSEEKKYYKIGMTQRKLKERLKEYWSKTELLYSFQTSNVKNVELEILKYFKNKYKIALGRERFYGNKDEMIEDLKMIENHCKNGLFKFCPQENIQEDLIKTLSIEEFYKWISTLPRYYYSTLLHDVFKINKNDPMYIKYMLYHIYNHDEVQEKNKQDEFEKKWNEDLNKNSDDEND